MSILQSFTRVFAFVMTELVQVVRRPSAFFGLVLGPFLILAVFGIGLIGIRPPVRAVIVVPPSSGLQADVKAYARSVTGLEVVAIVPSAGAAEQELRDHSIDAIIVYPASLVSQVEAGRKATIDVEVSVSNPTDIVFVDAMSAELASRTNEAIIAQVVSDAQKAVPGTSGIPADVIAAPTQARVENLAPVAPAVVPFYGPAVLILVLQHLCVTLVALALLLERKNGVFELFRVGPTNAWEIIAGKLIAFLVIGSVIAAASLALLAFGLGVPFLGSLPDLVAIVGLVLLASIGIGLLLGALADSERMALQASLLLLLASIFFSGFILELNLFSQPVQVAAQVLPATNGIALLQSDLLFGSVDPALLFVLAGIAVVTIVASWLLVRRSMAAIV